MGFLGFGSNYYREGPGIRKDAPKKKGFALFMEIFTREWAGLWALNIVFILCCAPIITIGPAMIAMSRVTMTMVRDKNVYPVRDFFAAFKENFKKGLIIGIPTTALIAIAMYMMFQFMFLLMAPKTSFVSIAFIIIWFFVTFGIITFLYPMVANMELSIRACLKNSLLLFIVGGLRSVAAIAIQFAIIFLSMYYFPISLIVLLFAGVLSLSSLLQSFWVWPVLVKYVVKEENPQENTEETTKDIK